MFYRIETQADGQRLLKTSLKGKPLLFHPLLNKGSAFTEAERRMFALEGKIPPVHEDLQKQILRAYHQYQRFETAEAKSIYLHALFNTNEVLFYAFITAHIAEITDKLYTPTVGLTVKDYSAEFRQPRGLFITANDTDKLDRIFANRTNPDLDLLVISDGEAILGIGDQGIGGMGIPVAKAAMHVASGIISPYRIAPIMLDVGTNNQALLDNPLYLGSREKRLEGQAYQAFMRQIIDKIYTIFPHVVIHFEDFSKRNARWLLDTYADNHACFNDDIQGTAAVVLSAIMTALHHKGEAIEDQRIMLVGPGAAGLGIMQTIAAYLAQHIPETDAHDHLWLVGRDGVLVGSGNDEVADGFAKDASALADWPDYRLETAVRQVKPTILIGVTGQSNLFTQAMLHELLQAVDQPIILPLSNPSDQSECHPQLVFDADKPCFIATGSPFTVLTQGRAFEVAQCNNLYAFPGIAAGMIACRARCLTQAMIIAAAEQISAYTLQHYQDAQQITPKLADLPHVAQVVARGVLASAVASDHAYFSEDEALQRLANHAWQPHYLPYAQLDQTSTSC